jgi:hypothetical protein
MTGWKPIPRFITYDSKGNSGESYYDNSKRLGVNWQRESVDGHFEYRFLDARSGREKTLP